MPESSQRIKIFVIYLDDKNGLPSAYGRSPKERRANKES